MLATTISIIATISMTNGAEWGYDKPGNNASHWKDLYAECGYSRQSPIDLPIDLDTTNQCSDPLEIEWNSEPSHYVIRNTGKSLLAMPFTIDHSGGVDISSLEILHHTNDTNIRLTNSFYTHYESGVNKEYCFDSLHFHWGKTNAKGSEHTVNGESFPLEVHLVHYSCDYDTAGPAINDYATGKAEIKYDDENVLAVIGVIFEIGKPNPILNKILDDMIIDGIYEGHKSTELTKLELYYTEFNLKELLPESREFVGYLGSLTTPPCFETVRWHVLKEHMTVSVEQMEKFRMLLASDDANDTQSPNFRPPLPINDRTIYQCSSQVDDDALFADIAEKDAYIKSLAGDDETEELEETDGDNNSSNVSETEELELVWKFVGIGFIVLFLITLIICMVAIIYLYKFWARVLYAKGAKKERKSSLKHEKLEEHISAHELPNMGLPQIGGTNNSEIHHL
mmetsp:Transcript_12383/g.10987  ORF Transcript_12383/g.10987 Transcript_12383/m.10987 type:complete len:453 (-) Transcript_12383:356-1714(-)